jgi:hypothetical protein
MTETRQYSVWARDDIMAWRDKHHILILTNIHDPQANGKFCVDHGNGIKPILKRTTTTIWDTLTKMRKQRPVTGYNADMKLEITLLSPVTLDSSEQLPSLHFMMCQMKAQKNKTDPSDLLPYNLLI